MGFELEEALETIQAVNEESTVKEKKKKTKKQKDPVLAIDEGTISGEDTENYASAIAGIQDALSGEDLFDEDEENKPKEMYTTELINHIKEIESFMSLDEVNSLLAYVKGGERPRFMDSMMTHTNEKLTEAIKLMTITQLLRLPALFDYQNSLTKTMMSQEALEKMSVEDVSRVSANIQKEIQDTLQLSMRAASQLSNVNTIPTKVEKLANALLYVSDSTRERIEELIRMEN